MFFLPIQDTSQEFFPPKVMAGFVLGTSQMFFDSGLRSHASVIHSGKPQYLMPQHAGAACQDVLNRVVQDMPEGEHSGNVGWRNDN